MREHSQTALVPQSQAFVPVTLDEPAPSPAQQSVPDIRVEVHRANTTIVVKWPLQGGAACAAWLREPAPSALAPQSQAFVPVTLDELAPGSALQFEPDIRVEVHRASTTIVVKWPLQGGAACAAWLREWLR